MASLVGMGIYVVVLRTRTSPWIVVVSVVNDGERTTDTCQRGKLGGGLVGV